MFRLDELGAVDASDVDLGGLDHDAVARAAGEVAPPLDHAVVPPLGRPQLHAQPHALLEVHPTDVLDHS